MRALQIYVSQPPSSPYLHTIPQYILLTMIGDVGVSESSSICCLSPRPIPGMFDKLSKSTTDKRDLIKYMTHTIYY